MTHMEFEITWKGTLCSVECTHCWTTSYAHEWASWDFNAEREAMEKGLYNCQGCGRRVHPDTYRESKPQTYYGARYSAPGYLDRTEWLYGTNKRKLAHDCRALYGA